MTVMSLILCFKINYIFLGKILIYFNYIFMGRLHQRELNLTAD
jgi:hypothetical protein